MKFNKKWLWLIIPIMIISLVCLNASSVSTVLLAIQGAITDGNLIKFSGTNGIGVDTGLSATNVVKCKFDAAEAPTVDNDVDEEYTVGSRWLDITNNKSYVCLDNTDGAAVWIETTGAGAGALTYLELTDTPAAYEDGKYAKSTAEGVVWDTPVGAGTVDTSGTPIQYDYARFTGATTIEGREYSEVRTDLGLVIGTNVQAYDAGLLSLAGLTYASPSFIKVTATDTYAIRTIAEVITDLALDSDDLSDVAFIAMLDEDEAITGAWTVTGSIAGVDMTEFGYLADISAFGGSIIDDADEATFKATVNLEIGIDVLAYQAIGIADNNLVEMDDADAAVDDYCKLTINGIAGRSYSEVRTDLGLVVGTNVQAYDAGLLSLAGLTYISDSFIKVTAEDTYTIRTIAETKTDLAYQLSDMSDVGDTTPTNKYVLFADGDSWESRALVEADISDFGTYLADITGESIGSLSDVDLTDLADTKILQYNFTSGNWECETAGVGGYTDLTEFVDQIAWRLFYSNADGAVIELPLGVDGTYLGSNGATSAPSFSTPEGAGDMLKTTYDTDGDDDIDVAAGGTEKSAWTQYAIPYLSGTTAFGEIPIGTAEYALTVNAGATGYDFTELAYNSLAGSPSDRITAGDKLTWDVDTLNVTETDPNVDTDAEIKAILVDEVTKTGDFTAGRIAKINNATGIIEQGTNTDTDVADAVTKKHVANADTDLDGTFEATFVKKVDTVNVLSDITSAGANIEDAVTKKHTQNTDTQFDFYNALGSDHLYSGDKDTQLVGESVVFGDLLYFNWTDKEWKKTDADAAATMPGLRIALESKSDGQTCLMLVKGYIRDDSAFEFAGSMVYTSVTPGAMSSTAPTETGDQVQRVGVAKSADTLFFDPSIDVGEI